MESDLVLPTKPTLGMKAARLVLRIMRWEMAEFGAVPSKCVMIAAPHTSNMDGVMLVLLTRSIGLKGDWLVKNFWTKPPFGWATKRVGALGVDRSQANGLVGQMADLFAERDEFVLLVPPEGTRSRAEHWRSGFYRIALGADVPVVPAFLDYSRKEGRFGEAFVLTGDAETDMDIVRSHYGDAAAIARFPDKFGPVRLREED